MRIFKDIYIWCKIISLYASSIGKDKVFIARAQSIGDVFWAEPVIRVISDKRTEVVVITKIPEIFENYPQKNVIFKGHSDKVFKRTVKFLRFINSKMLIDLDNAYEKNPGMHILHAYQQQAEIPFRNEYPKAFLTKDEKNSHAHFKPYIVIHIETTSTKNHRNIFGVKWQETINYLNERGFNVIFIGKEKPVFSNIIYFNTTLRQAFSLIYNSSIFIGLDSGPSHFAASFGIPSIIFFGSVNPWYRHFKESFNGIIMQQYCEHQHCWHAIENTKTGPSCRLVGDEGIPKCSLFETQILLNNIDELISIKQGIETTG